jgi:hypothetical protein
MNIQDLEQHLRDSENIYKYAKLRLSVLKNRLEKAIAWYVRGDNNLSFSYIEKLIKKEVTEEMTHYDIQKLIDEKLKKVQELS